MPNIGAVLREEIARLSRRENRGEIGKTKKATAQHRREIAQLKRQVVALERQLKLFVRKFAGAAPAAAPNAANTKARFVAKGLRSQRNRLGLSAADFGQLVGVTAQSIYNWENGKARPRGDQLSKLAGLRGVGKREAAARLGQGAAPSGNAKKPAAMLPKKKTRKASAKKSPAAGRKTPAAKRKTRKAKRKAAKSA